MPTIPVLGVDRVAEYFDVVHNWALDNGGDIGIRLTSFDLGNGSPVESLLSRLRVPIDRLHLIMDYGSLPPALFGPLKVAAPMQLSQLPRLKEWKTFTVAASGFPANLSDVNQYSMDEFTRTEWLLWRHLQSERERIERLPAFGDYAVSHPELLEFDPRKMRTSPKIKYTDDLRWLVAKGESFRRKSDTKKPQHAPAKEQYQRLAKMITGHDAWREANFSWGDRQIDAAAAGNGRSDATTWVTVGTVHHIVFVVRQIASLHEF